MSKSTLQIDNYFTSQAEAESLCYEYARIWDVDVLIYLTVDGFLRAKVVQQQSTNTLAEGVVWFGTTDYIPDLQGLRIFFVKTDGTWWVMRYKEVGDHNPDLVLLPIHEAVKTFSVGHLEPRWILLIDNGTKHLAYTTLDDSFKNDMRSDWVYDNRLNDTLFTYTPRIGIHKDNTQLMTVAVNFRDSSNNSSGVATYAAKIPGFDQQS